jgi:superfamily II RNA helicase
MEVKNTSYSKTNKDLIDFIQWDFELSDFQKWAILGMKTGKNVVITAFTGSGKTLPAEWAINYFHSLGKKVIYTTPIKALTNEKHYELSKKYPHISFGKITGDTKYNPMADCLVMTTECARNNMFNTLAMEKNSEIKLTLDFEMDFNKLGIVIFDELHWINDKHRGAAWDETIMLLNECYSNCLMLGLSATMSKPEKVCDLFGKKRDVWLCPNAKRIVPLEHYSYITVPKSILDRLKSKERDYIEKYNEKLITIKSADGKFDDKKVDELRKIFPLINSQRKWIKKEYVLNNLLSFLKTDDKLPAILYIYSRKQCNLTAKKITLTLFEEDSKIQNIIKKEIDDNLRQLPNFEELKVLPGYIDLIKNAEKGIAVHHGGITKEFREVIEILFKRKYFKLLIATETMGVGVNMPVKTTIYTSLNKFDGQRFRFLLSSEYAQQSGRAGRRGIDIKGFAIHLLNLYDARNQMPNARGFGEILSGKPDILCSRFKIDFNLILRLISTGYTYGQMVGFINNSMLKNEIDGEIKEDLKYIELKKQEYGKSLKSLEFLRTNKEIIEQYLALQLELPKLSQKKKKKALREIDFIEKDNKFLKQDMETFQKPENILKEIDLNEKRIERTKKYIENELNLYIKILESEQFILNEDNNLSLKIKGEMATQLQEVHSLVLSNILEKTHYFSELSAEEIVPILSIFTDIRISDDYKVNSLSDLNITENAKQMIKVINKEYDYYYDLETKYETICGENYNYNIHYDLCDTMNDWVNSSSETECKRVYQEALKKDIFVADFVKAVLKINNIAAELEKVCILENKLDLLSKLKKVSELTLKSIVYTNSLYLHMK